MSVSDMFMYYGWQVKVSFLLTEYLDNIETHDGASLSTPSASSPKSSDDTALMDRCWQHLTKMLL